MSTQYYVYSTLTCDQAYAVHARRNGVVIIGAKVVIRGGANITDKHFVTPKGVVTTVSESDYKLLQGNPMFARHVLRGFIKVEQKPGADLEKVVSDMTPRDESAPLTPDDFTADGGDAPVVNGGKKGKGGKTDAPPPPPVA